MRREHFLCLVLLLSGCENLQHRLGIHDGHAEFTPNTYMTAGQSNADRMTSPLTASLHNSFIDVAVGGSSLNEWMPGTVNYNNMIAFARKNNVSTLFWWQGEAEAVSGPPSTWAMNFSIIVTSLRKDLGRIIPVYFYQLGPASCGLYWNQIKAQQELIHLEGVTMIRTDFLDKSLTADCVHFSPDGYTLIAARTQSILNDR